MDTIIIIDSSLGVTAKAPLHITTIGQLYELHQMLEIRLAGVAVELGKEEYLRIDAALRLARQENVTVPRTTLIGAILQGNLPSARKPKGRWEIPVTEFQKWLQGYKERNGYPV